jgi:hypothetical protein
MAVTTGLATIDRLEPIGLDELTGIADLQTRADRKYLVPLAMADELVDAIATAARALDIDGARSFRYESVYFDTADLTSYLGAARRRPHRFKVRTRSYLDAGSCFLEVKTRDARGRNVKHRHPYDHGQRTVLTDEARRFVATVDQAAQVVDGLRPTLSTSYRRSTLVLGGGEARLTVDVDLAWAALLHDGHRTTLDGLALIETKTPGRACPTDRALWRHGQRPVTISKYCTGLAALSPGLPANKWNRVLRQFFDWPPALPT